MADSQKFLSSSRPARVGDLRRVSTDMQTERFGLDLQLHDCRRYAAQHGYDIVKEYVEGGGVHGVSGATTCREQTTAILSDLQQLPGMFTLLLIYDTSRLARDDSGVFGRWYEDELRKLGAGDRVRARRLRQGSRRTVAQAH